MQTYETLFITSPTLTEDEEKSTVETLLQVVTSGGGSLVTNERMGRRHLAYPIQKHNDGIYVRFLYDSDAAVPKELERRMRLSDQVLRALTVRLDGDWATQAKEQAVRDAEARVEAERLERERVISDDKAREEQEARAAAEPAPVGLAGEGEDDDDEAFDDVPDLMEGEP